MSNRRLFIFMTIIIDLPAFIQGFGDPQSLIGRTPCCMDRLSTQTCTRIRNTNEQRFADRCSSDVDFAMIQCCGTCFDRRLNGSSQAYENTVRRTLKSPFNQSCWDRRGQKWCTQMVQRSGSPDNLKQNQLNCAMYPYAFRECRLSCGYCNSPMLQSRIDYNHKLATNPKRCDLRTYFARPEEEKIMRRKPEFDPLALLKLAKYKPDDYFVATDHSSASVRDYNGF